jgi:hypothetical protein
MNKNSSKNVKKAMDLSESADDKKHLRPESAILDLPEVKDIPGQEYVHPLPPGEMADTTISSADEEADYLFEDEEGELQNDLNVSRQEAELLKRSSESMATEDDLDLSKARLDDTDDEGTLLNEKSGLTGRDLDVPGSEDDDANEDIGEEDAENNSFSLPDQGDN